MKYLSILLALFFSCSMTNLIAQEEEFGLASYYSNDFQGRDTAYGDTYDKNAMTCAHKRHPYGTRLRVTRLDNNESVTVKVIDKGPFIKGRVVDLSYLAAERLGIIGEESVRVKVEKVNTPSVPKEESIIVQKPAEELDDNAEDSSVSIDPIEEKRIEPTPPVEENKIEESAPIVEREVEKTATTPIRQVTSDPVSRSTIVGDDFTPYGLYEIVLKKPERKGYGVQVASLSNFDNVLKKVADLQANWFENILISMEAGTGGNNQYKVILGPFATQKEANHYQASLKTRYRIDGFVINLEALEY